MLDTFEKRKERRRAYSLRAFARDIGLGQSHLADILSKRRGLSLQLASKIVPKLELSAADAEFFCDLVESEHARSLSDRSLAFQRIQKRVRPHEAESLSPKQQPFLEHWFYAAILEVITLSRGQVDAVLIAERLQLEVEVADRGLKFLEAHSFIREADGLYVRLRDYVHVNAVRLAAFSSEPCFYVYTHDHGA